MNNEARHSGSLTASISPHLLLFSLVSLVSCKGHFMTPHSKIQNKKFSRVTMLMKSTMIQPQPQFIVSSDHSMALTSSLDPFPTDVVSTRGPALRCPAMLMLFTSTTVLLFCFSPPVIVIHLLPWTFSKCCSLLKFKLIAAGRINGMAVVSIPVHLWGSPGAICPAIGMAIWPWQCLLDFSTKYVIFASL